MKGEPISFGKISEIDAHREESWRDRIFLTFDVDWAHDEVLEDTLDLVRSAQVPVTWFVTHPTSFLDTLRREPCEIGIHPNFNPLLENKGGTKQAAEIVDELLVLAPGATSVRSHCLVRSSRIEQVFWERGLTHESNDLIPASSGIALRPFHKLTAMTQVPYCWADEASWASPQSDDFRALPQQAGLAILDFHPIHVFLNTESRERYESTRDIHRQPDELLKHRHTGVGTRTRLLRLLDLA